MERIKIEHHTFIGWIWLIAWLFTVGFLKLTFWASVFAIIIWPYYLGVYAAALVH